MARRVATNALTFDMIVDAVREMLEESETDVVKLADVAKRLDTYPSDVMVAWNNADPDSKIIDGDRGEMWLAESEEENDNKPPKPVTVPVAEPAKATTPAERFKARKAAPVPAVTPVLDNAGEPIIAPETGGRQLDASQGERVLSEGEMRELVKGTDTPSESENVMTEITGSWVNEDEPTHFVDYDPTNVTGHMILPETEYMDAPPVGVNPNIWELYKAGATLPARIYWGGKVRAQMDAYAEALKAEEEAKAQEVPPVSNWTPPIDPVTNEPFPF